MPLRPLTVLLIAATAAAAAGPPGHVVDPDRRGHPGDRAHIGHHNVHSGAIPDESHAGKGPRPGPGPPEYGLLIPPRPTTTAERRSGDPGPATPRRPPRDETHHATGPRPTTHRRSGEMRRAARPRRRWGEPTGGAQP